MRSNCGFEGAQQLPRSRPLSAIKNFYLLGTIGAHGEGCPSRSGSNLLSSSLAAEGATAKAVNRLNGNFQKQYSFERTHVEPSLILWALHLACTPSSMHAYVCAIQESRRMRPVSTERIDIHKRSESRFIMSGVEGEKCS